ncbi:MAG: serine/threonine protein kinase [Myxococcota bacterium]
MSLETYGRYQLLKKLATGGMAQIYLARQLGPEGFEKLLVVKRILPHLAENEDFITMFLDEARIAARLNHPNIVQIFDLGAQDDSFFIAMEFIHGEDVRRVWKHADKVGRPIPLALICRIIIDACSGLDYAHKKPDAQGRPLNIVHRDISPQNILVSFEGGVKVVDFGIAKAADQATVTKSGVLKGKYSYMSPEQAAGQAIDCRTDIFALGVVLYELLTGTRLFKRATDIQTLNAVTECSVAPPSEVNTRVPADLSAIVMKALAKDRTARFGEARQLGAALEKWLLDNQQNGSSAALAEFMHEIYAERLAREAEEGRLLVETAEHSRGEEGLGGPEKATPSIGGLKRPTQSMRATQSAARPKRDLEATAAERPARSGTHSRKAVERALSQPSPPSRPVPQVRAPTEASMSTQGAGAPRSRVPVLLVGAAALLAVLGFGAWVLLADKAGGLSLDTEPSGARVLRDGVELCVTPCELAELPPGLLALTIEKDGFRAEKRSLILKAGVHEAMGSIALTRLEARGQPPVVEAPREVLERFESEPPGAQLTLNGEVLGVTPLERKLPVGAEVALALELAGHAPVTDSYKVSAEPSGPHRYTLKTTGKAPGKVGPVVKPPPVETPKPPPVAAARGTVRFVVKPSDSYAVVDCPTAHFKDTTPFADPQFPAGEYTCTFTNPDYPPQTKVVRVEPNATVKVVVDYRQQ